MANQKDGFCLNCKRKPKFRYSRFCTSECKRAYRQAYGIYVSSGGDDISGDGSEENPYRTFEHARETAGDDYVIYRKGGLR